MNDKYFDQPLTRTQHYTVTVPAGGWRRLFPAAYIKQIQPIAETLAMLSHRPSSEYESYLQEADAVYRNESTSSVPPSWIRQQHVIDHDPALKDQWDRLQVLLTLKLHDQ